MGLVAEPVCVFGGLCGRRRLGHGEAMERRGVDNRNQSASRHAYRDTGDRRETRGRGVRVPERRRVVTLE